MRHRFPDGTARLSSVWFLVLALARPAAGADVAQLYQSALPSVSSKDFRHHRRVQTWRALTTAPPRAGVRIRICAGGQRPQSGRRRA